MNESEKTNRGAKHWSRRMGPGVITAAVVIGPGSVTVASKIGAAAGMDLLWLLIIAGSFMAVYTTLSARIGMVTGKTAVQVLRARRGAWAGCLVGLSAFLVCAGFQSSNYLACAAALKSMFGLDERLGMGIIGALGLWFVVGARRLFRASERVMTLLVGIMLVAFVVNLAVSAPSLGALFSGVVPKPWPSEMSGLALAMYATTFSIIAALYQSSLTVQKGWGPDDVHWGTREAALGVGVLFCVSLMIMWTSATVLPGKDIQSAADMAEQLRPAVGPLAEILFSVGFLSAAISSTVLNAMLGGSLFVDGIGKKPELDSAPARWATVGVMLVGLGAGGYLLLGGDALAGIVWAQKSTIIAAPVAAIALWSIAADPEILDARGRHMGIRIWAGIGALTLLSMSGYRIWELFTDRL